MNKFGVDYFKKYMYYIYKYVFILLVLCLNIEIINPKPLLKEEKNLV